MDRDDRRADSVESVGKRRFENVAVGETLDEQEHRNPCEELASVQAEVACDLVNAVIRSPATNSARAFPAPRFRAT